MSTIYLISTLPMLREDAPPPISPERFLAMCGEQLTASEAAAAAQLLAGPTQKDPPVAPFVGRWRDKEAILRNAIAVERARRVGQDPVKWLRPTADCDVRLARMAEAVLQERGPLAKEKAVDHALWVAADEMGGPDPMAVERVYAYAVQLAILTRWQTRSPERGRETFAALTEVPITL